MVRLGSAALALASIAILATAAVTATSAAQDMHPQFALEDVLAPAFPYYLVAARSSERIAWVENERGARNVYTAAAPLWRPIRLTSTSKDDGEDLRPLQIADDGSVVIWIRGHAPGIGSRPDMPGWIANPAANPAGGRTEVWAAATAGDREPWRVVSAQNVLLSPDGRFVLYEQHGQIYRAEVAGGEPSGSKPFIRDFGVNTGPAWSPDSRRIAWVSDRDDHSFIGVFDSATQRITYMAPSVDFDSAPAWSPDGRRLAFVRRPGRPFADWPQAEDVDMAASLPAGFSRRAAEGMAIWIADVETGQGRRLWRVPAGFHLNPRSLRWIGDHLVFDAEPSGWRHLYELPADDASPAPRLLTPGDGEIEHVAAAADGRALYVTANFGDPERRQLWRVPLGGGPPVQMTFAPGITSFPAVPGGGEDIAILRAGSGEPLSVALVHAAEGQGGVAIRRIAPVLPTEFPRRQHVEPQRIVLTASDGLRSYAQLMLPPGLGAGERRPALLFIHGGPRQQMLLGYHHQAPHGFYHLAYAVSQYFANKGYVTLSVNYRGGIGYGRAFREAPELGGSGNSEYRDVLAAGRWLQDHPQVDPARIGVWGLSYGGMLTMQALARDSDLFASGAAIGGFALWEWSLDPQSVSFRASPVAAIDRWRSPVLLIHGDDDRNVDFSYTVALVQLLRAREIPHELIVFPNETHYFLVWQRWLDTFGAMDDFFDRTLLGSER